MRYKTMLLFGLVAAMPLSAQADENTLYIQQQSLSTSVLGNTLDVDQSKASGSIISGLVIDSAGISPLASRSLEITQTALQRGEGNRATIDVTGKGGQIGLFQSNVGTAGNGNSADIKALGGGNAMVSQLGSGNIAAINLNTNVLAVTPLNASLDSAGTVVQVGNRNNGTVNTSNGGSGVLVQLGSRNTMQVNAIGTNVVATQIGSGMTAVVPAQVISNGATVQITQTQFQGVK